MTGRLEQFGVLRPPGETIYVVFWRDVEACNPSTGAWGLPNSGTWSNYVQELFEKSIGRADVSQYEIFSDGFDLAKLCPTLLARNMGRNVVVRYYLQAGGVANPATDQILAEQSLCVAFGRRGIGPSDLPRMELLCEPGYRSDLTPKLATFWVKLHVNDDPVNLTGVSGNHIIAVTVRKEGASSDLLTVEDSTIRNDGSWYLTYETPGYEKGRLYWITVTYRQSGSTPLLERTFPFFGA